MEYSKIIAVTGLPGLYELISSKTDGAIVRSLDDKSTRFVSSRIHNFSHLESIEVYTVKDNVNLIDVLKAMEASSEKLPADKSGADLKSYFEKVYKDIDFERVYSSDLKKMVKWFSVLHNNKVELKLSQVEEPAAELPVVEEEKKPKAKKAESAELVEAPKEAKPAAKKAAVKKTEEEKPKAKTAEKEVKAEKTEKAEKPKKAAEKTAEKPAAKKSAKKS